MPGPEQERSKPRTYFLNERQELASFEHERRPNSPEFVSIDWSAKTTSLGESFERVTTPQVSSQDPSVDHHFFLITVPEETIQKVSKSKKANEGTLSEVPSFGGGQSRLFRKLGIDLIETHQDGRATVHVPATNVIRIRSTIASLRSASEREKARWIYMKEFEPIDWSMRVDADWLNSLDAHKSIQTVIRFQPTLSRLEASSVIQAVQRLLTQQGDGSARLLRNGREFSGRYWCSGVMPRQAIGLLAKEFTSIQSIHPPLATPLAGSKNRRKAVSLSAAELWTSSSFPSIAHVDLPTVAVVDSGIPEQHVYLGNFRRSGGYRHPDLEPFVPADCYHGTMVASAIVFGNLSLNPGMQSSIPTGCCRVMDVNIREGIRPNHIDDDNIIPALEAIVGTSPDVRVFNMSFGGPPLKMLSSVAYRENLAALQNLDNHAFARDTLLVLAAGNAEAGLVPNLPYPDHVDDPRWSLGTYASSFNGIVCGAFVNTLDPNNVVQQMGGPTPFTRIGPGLCDSPVPGFSAPGGVGVLSYSGQWEDGIGTSFAAPLAAREAAWAFREIGRHCIQSSLPFAGTVKAWLHLVAARPSLQGRVEALARRTLGRGYPKAERLWNPISRSAVLIWQTLLQTAKSVNRVQFPVPLSWLREASEPRLRVVAAWNTPVNAALVDSWACRKVGLKVRPFSGEDALRGGGVAKGAYPLIDRTFDIRLDQLSDDGFAVADALWTIEAEYEDIGEYPPAMVISPQQRLGVVIELWDESENPVSPQAAIQSLPISIQMDRLGLLQVPLQAPVRIKL